MAASADRNKKKSGSKNSKASKRVREERADAFRRGINLILGLVLCFLVLFGAYEGWLFLGRPGFSFAPSHGTAEYVTIYYFDNAVTYLVPVRRQVTLARNDSLTARAITEFTLPPNDPRLARIYPDIEPPMVSIKGKKAIIDLPGEIWAHLGGTSRERALLDALTLITKNAGECTSVRVLVDGGMVETTPEGFDLSKPLQVPEYINKVPDSKLEGISNWVTVYFLDSTETYLIPLSLEIGADREACEEAVMRILEEPPALSFPPPQRICPAGYSLSRLAIENGVATVNIDVTEVDPGTSFGDYNITKFSNALYLTLKESCNARKVNLQLDGKDAGSYTRFDGFGTIEQLESWNIEQADFNNDPDIETEKGADL